MTKKTAFRNYKYLFIVNKRFRVRHSETWRDSSARERDEITRLKRLIERAASQLSLPIRQIRQGDYRKFMGELRAVNEDQGHGH